MLATSWPHAMNIAVRPFAACAPLFAEAAMKLPAREIWRPHINVFVSTPDDPSFAETDLVPGPATVTVEVPGLDPGSYPIGCVVHVEMTGTLVVA